MSRRRPTITAVPEPNAVVNHQLLSDELKRLKNRICSFIRQSGFEEPDDILQEIACAVFEAKGIKNAEAYIIRTMFNCVKAAQRERYQRLDKPVNDSEKSLSECEKYLEDTAPRERAIRERKDFQAATALGFIDSHLPDLQAKVLKLTFLQNLPNDRIAEELNINETYVRQLKSRGFRRLRTLMSPAC